MVTGIADSSPKRLMEILHLDNISDDVFEGATNGPSKTPRLFGGHLLAQSLMAIYRTVEGRRVHVLHTQFLSPGLIGPPIRYNVERERDGRSFSARQLTAIQGERVVCTMSASFHVPETGVEHQDDDCVPVLPPSGEEAFDRTWAGVEILDVRQCSGEGRAQRRFWFRIPDDRLRDSAADDCALAYASDIRFGTTPLLRHSQEWCGMRNASLDHSIWFHRPANPAQWTFFDQYSPTAASGRGFTRGEMRSADGALLASIAQESLLRT